MSLVASNQGGTGPTLDAGQRMSVLFRVKIITERADYQARNVDQAIARLRSLYRTGQGRGTTARKSGVALKPGKGQTNMNNGPMTALVVETSARIETKAERALIEATRLGEDLVKQGLREAITVSGARRYLAGRGNSAGRDDTGTMIKEVVSNTSKRVFSSSTTRSGNQGRLQRRGGTLVVGGARNATLEGFFGWDSPALYMVAQEKGFKHARWGTGDPKKAPKRARPYVRRGGASVEGALALAPAMLAARQHLIRQLRSAL